MMKNKDSLVLKYLHAYYEDARCALNFSNDLECLVAILLSAQTTDISVNNVTPILFESFKSPFDYADASLEDIEEKIHSLGLFHFKAKNLKNLGAVLKDTYGGVLPYDFELLKKLPGVGAKTAGVFLLERGNRPAIPVDTHVSRVAYRLGYAKKDEDPLKIEAKLEKAFPKEEWAFLHHSLIWFGRKECHAKNPDCSRCELKGYCSYFKKTSSTTDK